MAERKLLGQGLNAEERILLAQLTTQPGWRILVKLMAEACRQATEEVIKLNPTTPRYTEVLAGLQSSARAMHQFSAEVLDSVKLHQQRAIQESTRFDASNPAPAKTTRFEGFKLPVPKQQSPSGSEVESN